MKSFALLTIATLISLFSLHTFADETYACLHEGSERIIKVAYTNPGSPVPCEVIYEKGTDSQVLWSAQNQEGYCESKAAEFAEKQRSWGWDCTKMSASTETPAAQ